MSDYCCCYSRKASELQSSDILLTTLLAQSFYPTTETLENLLSQSVVQSEWPTPFSQNLSSASDEFLSAGEEGSDDAVCTTNTTKHHIQTV